MGNADNSNLILLKMLRESQIKQNIYYLTTESSLFKFLKVMFYLSATICTVINLLFLLGQWGGLNANLANADALSDLQQSQVAGIKNGIFSVAVMGVILLLSLLFFKLRRPLLYGGLGLFSGIVLIFIYSERLSEVLSAGNYSSFIFKHVIPLGIFALSAVLAATIHFRGNLLDKKGCNEISEKIYAKYSVLSENITPEQWESILAEYKAESPKSKKRSVKNRLKKQKSNFDDNINKKEV